MIAPQPKCVVPKLKGKTLAQAKSSLAQARCKLGKVTRRTTRTGRRGRVIAQKPAPGKRLAVGTKVAVTLKR